MLRGRRDAARRSPRIEGGRSERRWGSVSLRFGSLMRDGIFPRGALDRLALEAGAGRPSQVIVARFA